VVLYDSLYKGKRKVLFDLLDYARGHKSRLGNAEAPDLSDAVGEMVPEDVPDLTGESSNFAHELEALDKARIDRNYLSPAYLRGICPIGSTVSGGTVTVGERSADLSAEHRWNHHFGPAVCDRLHAICYGAEQVRGRPELNHPAVHTFGCSRSAGPLRHTDHSRLRHHDHKARSHHDAGCWNLGECGRVRRDTSKISFVEKFHPFRIASIVSTGLLPRCTPGRIPIS
jgi:hypothetical protein